MKYFFEKPRNQITILHKSTLDFDAHLHTEAEIGYCKEGSSVLYIEDKRFEIKKGDFFIVFPNQIHRFELSENISATLIFLQPEAIPELRNILLKKSPVIPIVNSGIKNALQIISILESLTPGQYNTEIIHGLTLSLCGILFEHTEFEKRNEQNTSTTKNILIYCNEHFSEPITIEDVAQNLFMSRSHISHVFKDKLNSTFSQYITNRRIELACRLLNSSSDTITDIAFSTGFNSVRTFNRIFTKNIGCPPREYRNRYRY